MPLRIPLSSPKRSVAFFAGLPNLGRASSVYSPQTLPPSIAIQQVVGSSKCMGTSARLWLSSRITYRWVALESRDSGLWTLASVSGDTIFVDSQPLLNDQTVGPWLSVLLFYRSLSVRALYPLAVSQEVHQAMPSTSSCAPLLAS